LSELRVNNVSGVGGDAVIASGVLDRGSLPAGSVLQVVSTTKTDTFSASTGSGASVAISGLTATITPTSTSSKIMIWVNVFGDQNASSVAILPTRGGSAITGAVGDAAGSRGRIFSGNGDSNSFNQLGMDAAILFLDSPASTSAVTYGVNFFNTSGATQTLYVNRTLGDGDSVFVPRGASTIALMEVAG